MKHLFLLTILTLSVLLFNINAYSQSKQSPYRISGIIADSTSKDSLPYITVSLKKSNNSLIKVNVTKENGYFEFTNLEPVTYNLSVSAVGYLNKAIAVDLSDTTMPAKELGIIFISNDIKTLEGAVVTSERPIVRREIDRISYDLQADPESKSSSVLDIMRKVPFLSVDGNGNILLKGSSSYRIFINGKPSGMMTNNPKEILGSMPASTIKRIEVITTPPLKYDAEGLAGIINIILDKKIGNGITGNINVNGRFPQGGPGIGGSISIKQGKLGLTLFSGGNLNRVPSTKVTNNRNTFTSTPTSLNQNGFQRSNTRTGYAGAELNYEIDSLNLISATFNGYANHNTGDNFQNSVLTDHVLILEGYNYNNDYKNTGDGIDAGLNYQLGARADKNRLLTFSYSYRDNSTNQFNDVVISDRTNYNVPDYRQFNDGKAKEQTGQIDYIRPSKNLTIEAGVKGIFRANKSDYQNYSKNPTTKEFELNPSFSNMFNHTQNVYGVYNSYTYSKNSWTVRGGARLEQTVTDADFVSTVTKVHQNYVHFIPSVIFNYKLKKNSSLNFGFSRRIKRPGIYKLNPFVDRSNPNYEFSGNPNLRPTLVNNFIFGYGRSGKVELNIGAGYSFFSKLDFKVSQYDSTRKITTSTFQNIGKGSAYVFDLNINYPVNKRWNTGLNSNLTYIRISGVSEEEEMKLDKLMYNINLSSGYKFDKGWRINGNLTATGPGVLSVQSVSNSLVSYYFTFAKDFAEGKLSLSATINNPFTKYRNNRIETSGNDFFETYITREYFRNYGFNLNYRFGNLKGNIRKNKRGIINNDVSNKSGL